MSPPSSVLLQFFFLFPDQLFPITLIYSSTQRKYLVLGHAIASLPSKCNSQKCVLLITFTCAHHSVLSLLKHFKFQQISFDFNLNKSGWRGGGSNDSPLPKTFSLKPLKNFV